VIPKQPEKLIEFKFNLTNEFILLLVDVVSLSDEQDLQLSELLHESPLMSPILSKLLFKKVLLLGENKCCKVKSVILEHASKFIFSI
jgi:hypothetical protein